MTLPHEYPRFLGGGNESLSSMLGRLLSVEYGNTGDAGEQVCWSGFIDRPFCEQEPRCFLGGGYDAVLPDLPGLHCYGGVPSFRVHGAAPRGVGA
jgi:hypothetical protein